MIKFWRWPPKSTADKVYFGFVFFAIIASVFHFSSNKEGFLNMEKKYRNLKKSVSKNLEGMIDILPSKINIRKKAKKFKRKFIS
tara:strand:- start:21 stop:272 length:252 start_codon:yes stop_codon:yes gene_type:complete